MENHDFYSLIARLRDTGPKVNEENNVVEGRVPNYHDCHAAGDIIEAFLIYKNAAEMVVAETINRLVEEANRGE